MFKTVVSGLLLALMLGACAVRTSPPVQRIALLAPFEGRYREVGNQALYAGRLAIAETGRTDLELYAVDDGGTLSHAVDRARALSSDPSIIGTLALGYAAAAPQTQHAFDCQPVVIVGNWTDEATTESVTLVAPEDAPPMLSLIEAAEAEVPFTCGEVCMLTGFAALRGNLDGVRIISAIPPMPNAFRAAYADSDPFAPESLPLAYGAYLATRRIIDGNFTRCGAPLGFDDAAEYEYTYDEDRLPIIVS